MTRAAKHIYTLLDDHLGIYDNPQGIEFIMNLDDSVFVVSPIKPPPEPYVDYGLIYPCQPFNTFIDDFHFSGTRALQTMTQDKMWAMYHKGKAEIYCTLVVRVIMYALYFRLTKNNRMIVRDDYDREHTLEMVFTSPLQFLEYTESHFYQEGG
ncbi:MAG: hypothetical protein ACJ751_22295 [Niastella sp.]|jgi:hypothetical protein|uniref:hypothetical protein n=1 Tax=Niastella sp. TaxID=1869183 RepID=UPI00389AD2FA